MDVGLNVGVTFAGRPVTESPTALLKPFSAEVLMLTEPLLPCCIESEVGEAEILKVGMGAAVIVSVTVVVLVNPPPVPDTVRV
jgi:hypothetical protein